MKKNITRILFGITALGIGAFLLGAAFNLWELRTFDGWWTLFMIVPAIGSMISTGITFWNSLLLGAGVWLFVFEQNILSERQFRIIGLSVLFLAFGAWLVISSFKNNKKSNGHNVDYSHDHSFNSETKSDRQYKQTNDGNSKKFKNANFDTSRSPDYFALFSSGEHINCSPDLVGGSATAVFGGLSIDLTGVNISKNVYFQTNAIFGGVDIYVPTGMRVEVNGMAIFGGCDNLAPSIYDENLPILTIKYFAIFGGVDVKVK
ncbi:MAG TPA: LiaF domain-containing protein [Clostridia bacterium]|nr:LiaF domain-containing protein [Clostridia bacterium]